jgi:hypothetical protein
MQQQQMGFPPLLREVQVSSLFVPFSSHECMIPGSKLTLRLIGKVVH